MNVPTEDDWRSEPWGLDEEYAYEHFHGKTVEKAVRLFEENSLRYQEDLMYMPARVFGYYLRAYLAYLTSDAAMRDTDGASCFISLVAFKAEHKPDDVAPLRPEIEPVLRLLVERQEHVEDDEDFETEWLIYGSFRTRIHEIAQRGFPVSFDTTAPEVVPESVSLKDMGLSGRSVRWPVAVQLLRHSGVHGLDDASTKRDVLRVLGPPDAARVAGHPLTERYNVPDWIRYDRPDCSLNIYFEGDAVSSVFLAGPGPFTPPNVPDAPTADDLLSTARAVWETYLASLPIDDDPVPRAPEDRHEMD
jgi:hypothetical protein